MKPIIGVLPLVDDERESLWMLPGYMDGIKCAGALPIMLPLTADEDEIEQLINICDGFLFTGGQDVSPSLYNEEKLNDTVTTCKARDDMELTLLFKALKRDKPVLGICRGIQFINSALGGTLYQDLSVQHPSNTEHHQAPPYSIPVHTVKIDLESPLGKLLKKDIIEVNSYHHQAIKSLSAKLMPMAVSCDGLIEAVYKPDRKFVWAVQWHPEFSFAADENSRKIFKAFVNSAKSEI